MWAWVDYFFHWYTGAVWSNLLASLLWATPTVIVLTRRWRRHLHEHLSAHHESLAAHLSEELRDMLDFNGRDDHPEEV